LCYVMVSTSNPDIWKPALTATYPRFRRTGVFCFCARISDTKLSGLMGINFQKLWGRFSLNTFFLNNPPISLSFNPTPFRSIYRNYSRSQAEAV
jgi:hypothetical protein